MAITFVADTTIFTAGNAGTAALSLTPTLPVGTAANDRVFILVVGTTTLSSVPAGWTQIGTASLGTGTLGAGTGPRQLTALYRDYDGAWAMPTITQTSQASPTLAVAPMTYRKGATDLWNAPTFTTGSDVTVTATAYSATGAANLSIAAGDLVLCLMGNPSAVTITSAAITATGATLGTVTKRGDTGGNATGNGAACHTIDAFPTAGPSTAAPTQTATVSVSGQSSGGTLFIRQTVVPGLLPVNLQHRLPTNPAVIRAANW